MPRPKDAKVWNEDLVLACRARHEQCQQNGSRLMYWNDAAKTIESIRQDIYVFKTGRIVGLPSTSLNKNADYTIRRIITGDDPVYPPGYIPADSSAAAARAGAGAAIANNNRNPCLDDPYMRTVKSGGGAVAILLAFRVAMNTNSTNTNTSQRDTLTKDEICRIGQQFCEERMESNYFQGRAYGAWASNKTLIKHDLITCHKTARYNANAGGFRSQGPATYRITRKGELFTDALFESRPELKEQFDRATGSFGGGSFSVDGSTGMPSTTTNGSSSAASATGGSWGGGGGIPTAAAAARTGSSTWTTKSRSRTQTTPTKRKPVSANSQKDEQELREWASNAQQPGRQKTFKVGKSRRKYLHDVCDNLNSTFLAGSGMQLKHESVGTDAKSRTLYVTVVAASNNSTNNNNNNNTSSRAAGGGGGIATSPGFFSLLPTLDDDDDSCGEFAGFHKVTPGKTPPRARRHREDPPGGGVFECSKGIRLDYGSNGGGGAGTPPKRARRTGGGGSSNVPASVAAGNAALARQKALFQSSSTTTTTVKAKGHAASKAKPPTKGQMAAKSSSSSRKGEAAKKSIVIDLLSDDDDDDDSSSRKIPARKTTNSRTNITKAIDLLSDNDSSSDESKDEKEDGKIPTRTTTSSTLRANTKTAASASRKCTNEEKHKQKDILELLESDSDEDDIPPPSGLVLTKKKATKPSTPILLDDDEVSSPQKASDNKVSFTKPVAEMTILIDSRERDRNATPRMLRMELTGMVSSDRNSIVWPEAELNRPIVDEATLPVGDFAFEVSDVPGVGLMRRRLPIYIERKRVSDLVGRSVKADHWKQIQRIRDIDATCLFLIEGDFRTAQNFPAYGSQYMDDEYSRYVHTINDEETLVRFIGRTILSFGKSVRFIQTKDEKGSLRAVAAVAAVLAATSSPSKQTATTNENDDDNNNNNKPRGGIRLKDRLIAGGCPWEIAGCVDDAVGSIHQLQLLYSGASNDDKLLDGILIPVVEDVCRKIAGSTSTPRAWSTAIRKVFYSALPDPASAKLPFEESKLLVEDHARLLSYLHSGKSAEQAVNDILDEPSTATNIKHKRIVHIKVPKSRVSLFPKEAPNGDCFYKIHVEDSHNELIEMRTKCGLHVSSRLLVFVIEGTDLINMLKTNMKKGNYPEGLALAQSVASDLNKKCRSRTAQDDDTRIIIINGLQAAIDASARRPGHSPRIRSILEMVFASLMLLHNAVVLQAVRKTGDCEILLQQISLACFHYQLLKHKE